MTNTNLILDLSTPGQLSLRPVEDNDGVGNLGQRNCFWLKTGDDDVLRPFQPDYLTTILSEVEVLDTGVSGELSVLLRALSGIDLSHIRICLDYDDAITSYGVARGSLWTLHKDKDRFVEEVWLISAAGTGHFTPG
jgi:hypothetical protein